MLVFAMEKILRKVTKLTVESPPTEKKISRKIAILPCARSLPQPKKKEKFAQRTDVNVVVSPARKLASLCRSTYLPGTHGHEIAFQWVLSGTAIIKDERVDEVVKRSHDLVKKKSSFSCSANEVINVAKRSVLCAVGPRQKFDV